MFIPCWTDVERQRAGRRRAKQPPAQLDEHLAWVQKQWQKLGIRAGDSESFTDVAKYFALYKADAASKGLCLVGAPGTGKTALMSSFSTMFKASFLDATDLCRRCVDDRGYGYEVGDASWEDSAGLRWLDIIIDGLGTEPRGSRLPHHARAMTDVLLARWRTFDEHGALTFLTTSLTGDEISARYGDHVWSRIRLMCNVVELQGEGWHDGNVDL